MMGIAVFCFKCYSSIDLPAFANLIITTFFKFAITQFVVLTAANAEQKLPATHPTFL
jgi:hypothetical protein